MPQDLNLKPNAVVYAFGAGKDISFDLDLARRHGCTVHVFDPVAEACEHVKAVVEMLEHGKAAAVYRNDVSGQGYDIDKVKANQIVMHAYGLWDSTTILRFKVPGKQSQISHTATEEATGTNDQFVELPVKDILTIMQQLGHQNIDLLKMDIEGAEYRVLDHLLIHKILPPVLCMEVHGEDLKKDSSIPKKYLERLLDQGYSICDSDLYGNYTLIRS